MAKTGGRRAREGRRELVVVVVLFWNGGAFSLFHVSTRLASTRLDTVAFNGRRHVCVCVCVCVYAYGVTLIIMPVHGSALPLPLPRVAHGGVGGKRNLASSSSSYLNRTRRRRFAFLLLHLMI